MASCLPRCESEYNPAGLGIPNRKSQLMSFKRRYPMKRKNLCISMLGFWSLVASAQLLFAAGLSTWSSFVAVTVSYDTGAGGSDVVSRFTPTKAISVTRIEAQAAQGSQRVVFFPTSQPIACTNPVSFKITDGTTAFTLPLPSATTLVPGKLNPSSADSGPLHLPFAAGAKLVLTLVQGDPPDPVASTTGCFAKDINITVQYGTPTQDE